MNKKEQKLNMLLELSSLINSTISFDNNLLKIIKINSIYIYGQPYICDNDLILDNNIIFYLIIQKIQIINIIQMLYQIK